MKRVLFDMPSALFTASNAGDIPRVGVCLAPGAVPVDGDAYVAPSDVPGGLQLDAMEWGRQAYVLRRHIFSEDDVARIERAQTEDLFVLAERLRGEDVDFDDPYLELEKLQVFPDIIALRAAVFGFAMMNHGNARIVRQLSEELESAKLENMVSSSPGVSATEAIYFALGQEAIAGIETVKVLEILGSLGDGAAVHLLEDVFNVSSHSVNTEGSGDMFSIARLLVRKGQAESHEQVEALIQWDQDRRDQQKAFNENPGLDGAITIMIEEPERWLNAIRGFLSLASGDIETVKENLHLLSECGHPRLNEVVESMFALASHDNLAIWFVSEMARRHDRAWSCLDAMDQDELLSWMQKIPIIYEPLHEGWMFRGDVGEDTTGPVGKALAQVEEALFASVDENKVRALIEARYGKKADEDSEHEGDAAVISLLDFLDLDRQ